jgi:2-aminoethylphosphonate-pyruvate transaminase
MANMRELGFRGFLDDEYQGVILTTFHLPEHPNFNFIGSLSITFLDMQTSLEADGLIIFNEKTTQAPTFRIGSIGELSLA